MICDNCGNIYEINYTVDTIYPVILNRKIPSNLCEDCEVVWKIKDGNGYKMKYKCEFAKDETCAQWDCMHYNDHEYPSKFDCGNKAEYCNHRESFATCVEV